jgi:gamma-glutamyltranspeptidase/glutathione hydrolase
VIELKMQEKASEVKAMRQFLLLGLTFSITAAAVAENQKPVVGRSVVATKYGIVAASQPLAARAGVQILERGGNAVDAAVAANATIGLMEPTGNGIGGDLFAIIYWAKTGEVLGLNASGWSPAGLTVEVLASKGIEEMPRRGIYTVTVPGVVAGWDALQKKLGTLPLSEILAPAIYYAENGFPLSEVIAAGWARSEEMLAAHPNSKETFLPAGRPPKAGEIFKNPDLGASLRLVAEKGRDGYYKGKIADAILAISEETGGVFAAADLSEYEPEWVAPISTTYRGWKVYEIGPNTQGIAALMMLNLMERYPMGEYGFHSAEALHVMIEAKKLAYADMLHYVGDPRFSPVPVSQMLDKAHAAERAKRIDMAKAQCSVTPSEFRTVTDAEGGDTIYMTAIDKDGNIVSLIQSNYSGFGSGLVPKDTGFMLHNRGALFTMERERPNTLEPRKRPLHTIIPAFMEKDGTRIGFGIMGGWNQAQAHAQFVANVADFGMNIQEALEAGRFTKGTFDGCDLDMEPLVPESVRAALAKRGHQIEVSRPRSGGFGFGQAVMSTPDGVHFGASEPRHDGAAIPEAPPVFEK